MLVDCYAVITRKTKDGLVIGLVNNELPIHMSISESRLDLCAAALVSKHFAVSSDWLEPIHTRMWQSDIDRISALFVFELPWNVKQREQSKLEFVSDNAIARTCSPQDIDVLNKI